MLDLRAHFSHFLGAEPGRLHAAAHSHHPWPDVTREAQIAAWDHAARHMDDKWEEVLGPLLARVRAGVARHLNLPDPATLAFAPNTHEFLTRILSCLDPHRTPRIVTTDGEFHSAARQFARLEEEGLAQVTRIPSEPTEACLEQLIAAARQGCNLIWVSEVFFASGAALTGLEALAEAAGDALLVLDGYHAFLARPVDLSRFAGRAFYVAGGYKYAMAGEGCCFLHCPPGLAPRPRNTGWFAAFGALAGPQAGVPYAPDGTRFWGATFDPTALWRLDASLAWIEGAGLDAGLIHRHARALMARFLAGLEGTGLDPARLVVPLDAPRGNFLAFDLPDAERWQGRLAKARIITDRRGTRLRFGFGVYHTADTVDALLDRMRSIATGGEAR